MKQTCWKKIPEAKEKRRAELLVETYCPFSAITEIGVHDFAAAATVRRILKEAAWKPPIVVHRDWYIGSS